MAADVAIVGGGIFGLTAAIELRKGGASVTLINAGPIPDPLASSTDISKIIRMEYGTDLTYMKFAAECMPEWDAWNDHFNESLYRQTGFLLLCSNDMNIQDQPFEKGSYDNLLALGFAPERLNEHDIVRRYPMFREGAFVDGFFHQRAGYARSGRVLEVLCDYARESGIEVLESNPVAGLEITKGKATALLTAYGTVEAGTIVVAAGPGTALIVPGLENLLKVTGQPVFHLSRPAAGEWAAENMPVFAADIARTGWYGFPLHPEEDVIKVANHGVGQTLHPHEDERVVTMAEHERLGQFLSDALPGLVSSNIVYTRKCLYTDTIDGHFLIDRHPEIENLVVATGGSGHGFKMAPLLGKWISAAATGRTSDVPERFRWRSGSNIAGYAEEARNLSQ